MTRLSLCIAVAALAIVPGASAQFRPPQPRFLQGDPLQLPALPILSNVVAAEEEGRTFPRAAPDTARLSTMNIAPGFVARSCAHVLRGASEESKLWPRGSYSTEFQSGEFVIGGGIGRMKPGQLTKVYWVPMHDPSREAHGLLVRAARLGPDALPSDTVRFTSMAYAATVSRSPRVFFPSGFILPKAGTWLVVATSGPDWGCMLMDVS